MSSFRAFHCVVLLTLAVAGCQNSAEQVSVAPTSEPQLTSPDPSSVAKAAVCSVRPNQFVAYLRDSTVFQGTVEPKPNGYWVELCWPEDLNADGYTIYREDERGLPVKVAELDPSQKSWKETSRLKIDREHRYRLHRIIGDQDELIGTSMVRIPYDIEIFTDTVLTPEKVATWKPNSRLFLRAGATLRTDGKETRIRVREIYSQSATIQAFSPSERAADAPPTVGVGETVPAADGAPGRSAERIIVRAERAFGTLRIDARGETGGSGATGSMGVTGEKGPKGTPASWAFDTRSWRILNHEKAITHPELYRLSKEELTKLQHLRDLTEDSYNDGTDGTGRYIPDRMHGFLVGKLGKLLDAQTEALILDRYFFCDTPPGHGHRGGAGGRGGKGGTGGTGGDAAAVLVSLKEFSLDDPTQLHVETVLDGGIGGDAGLAGPGGAGGEGGEPGYNPREKCANASFGPQGPTGPIGEPGSAAPRGRPGVFCQRLGNHISGASACAPFDDVLSQME